MPKKGEAAEVAVADVIAAIEGGGFEWQAGETPLSQLPLDEKLARLGYTPGPGEPPLEEREAAAKAQLAAQIAAAEAVGYPATFDWRNVAGRNFITPIRDQGGCGSCVSFGTLATVEATARARRNDPMLAIDLSEAHLFYCLGGAAGRNCQNGWWPDQALNGVRDTGIVDEACFPYTAGNQACNLCSGWQSRVTKISGWHAITSTNDMRAWLAAHGPLVGCFTVYADFFNYTGGVYRHATGGVAGGHCVSVVGYDDINQYWICKNSWGTGFGEGGFFRIAYGEGGLDLTMWAVEDVASPTTATAALYRYYNSSIGDHFYTTNWGELGSGNYGWRYEGIQCYVCPAPAANSLPLYRYWNPGIGDHFYTTSWDELGRGNYGWGFEGIQCYVLIPEAAAQPESGPDQAAQAPESFTTQRPMSGSAPDSFTTGGPSEGGFAPSSFSSSGATGGDSAADSFTVDRAGTGKGAVIEIRLS